jgi:hypothetical protein
LSRGRANYQWLIITTAVLAVVGSAAYVGHRTQEGQATAEQGSSRAGLTLAALDKDPENIQKVSLSHLSIVASNKLWAIFGAVFFFRQVAWEPIGEPYVPSGSTNYV